MKRSSLHARRALAPLTLLSALVACGGDDAGGSILDAGPDVGSGDATPDAAHDATPGSDAGDAGGDASPLPVLSCAWKRSAPVVLEDLATSGGTGFFNGELSIGAPSAGSVRVISQPTSGTSFRVYGVARSTAAVATVDGPAIATAAYQTAEHFTLPSGAGVTQVLVQTEATDGALTILSFLVPDAMPGTGPLPAPVTLSAGGYGMASFPLDETTFFDAVTYTSASSGATIYRTLGVGRATATTKATLATVTLTANPDDLRNLEMAHAAGVVYLFTSNGSSLLGESVWAVPDTAVVPAPVNARVFDVGTAGRMIDVAPATAAATFNFAYYSASSAPAQGAVGAPGGTLRVGQVGAASLPGATAADLVVAHEDPDGLFASPDLRAEWSGDDLLILAAARAPVDGGAAAGINALWVDARGRVRAEHTGAKALSPDRTGIRAAAASRASETSWDVAWVEQRAGGDVLLYDELDCK